MQKKKPSGSPHSRSRPEKDSSIPPARRPGPKIGTDPLPDFYKRVSTDKAELFAEIAEKAIQSGFKPKRDKTKRLSISFTSGKYTSTILKFFFEKGQPALRLKFFAAKNYSDAFDKSLKRTIEQFEYKYTGCYGCGKCEGELEGYRIAYDDGREYFRCGSELIEILGVNNPVAKEARELIGIQSEYYEKNLKKNRRGKPGWTQRAEKGTAGRGSRVIHRKPSLSRAFGWSHPVRLRRGGAGVALKGHIETKPL